MKDFEGLIMLNWTRALQQQQQCNTWSAEFGFVIDGSQTSDHLQEELAKFGYKSDTKVLKKF
jgi:hypothetical protein